jgi:plastocyanin
VSVTYQNSGTTTWTSSGNYHLGSQDPQDNSLWLGTNRVYLPTGTSVAPGQSVTFTFTVTAPAQSGSYPFQWRMVQDGVQWFGDYTPLTNVSVTGGSAPAPTPGNSATFVSQSVPSSMVAGQTYSVSVTYQNSGTTTWTSGGNYHLGSQDPQDNSLWLGTNRVYLPTGTSVAPGQSVTFTFTVTAPAQSGSYPFQWRMVQDGVQWFGDYTPITNVSVG